MTITRSLCLLALCLVMTACAPQVRLFPDESDPLKESVLQGDGEDKVAVVWVRGMLHSAPREGLVRDRPSTLQEILSRLERVRADASVKAVVLAIDSPGGTSTASDVLHREVLRLRQERGLAVVAAMVGLATSGGYYAVAGADWITAHPTAVTGSIGTIFIRPDVSGLMGMVGVSAEVTRSGRYKDMGSPFRKSTSDERILMQRMIDTLNNRFLAVVGEGRGLSEAELAEVADARIMTAPEALRRRLVDEVGYLDDAVAKAREMAGLGADARVVVYRQSLVAEDTLYNQSGSLVGSAPISSSGLSEAVRAVTPPAAGFYHLWLPE